jgi:hypothetical protein
LVFEGVFNNMWGPTLSIDPFYRFITAHQVSMFTQ